MYSADSAAARCLSLSVHLSVTCQYCVKTAKHFIKFFSPLDIQIFLVFPHQTVWQYSYGDPANGGVEYNGGMKNHDFRQITRFVSEMTRDRAIVTMECEWDASTVVFSSKCLTARTLSCVEKHLKKAVCFILFFINLQHLLKYWSSMVNSVAVMALLLTSFLYHC